MKMENGQPLSTYQSHEGRRSKSRQVSSRFLSPSSQDNGIPSPSHGSFPLRPKPSSITRGHRSLENSGFIRGLWPSSVTSPSPSRTHDKNLDTLADHLKSERLNDSFERRKNKKSADKNSGLLSLGRQRSSTVFGRFENEKEKESRKENHRPIIGGSMRYTGKIGFSGKSSSSPSSSNSLLPDPEFVPGRLSVDESALYKNPKMVSSSRRISDPFADNLDSESSEYGDLCSSTAPWKPGIEVSSKSLLDVWTRSTRDTLDSNIQHPVSMDASPKTKKFTLRNTVKRTNSLTGYGRAMSQWALSPGRSGSPAMSVESKERVMSFSSLKPPSSPSRPKGMEKLLNLGLDLFKSKKSSSSNSLLVELGNVESIHQLRLLHNRLMQWRYTNARSDSTNENINKQVENNLLFAWDGVTKLQHSVLLKKLQLQKQKLEMKLGFILHSQIKLLEGWGDIERQHSVSVSTTKECLHAAVCRVPLIEGAKVDPQTTSVELRHALDLVNSLTSELTTFSHSAEKTDVLVSELAEVVSQEKLLIEECLELLQTMSTVEIEERSWKCHMIQLNLRRQQQQLQEDISS